MPLPGAAARAEGFDLAAAVPWFPLVGGLVGAIGGGLREGLDPVLGRGPSTVVAIAALVGVTGALHQDALADTVDGLGVRGDRARRLLVMRESTLGAFGVLALVLWALLMLTSLEGLSAGRALVTLVSAEAVARLAAVLHGRLAAPARREGLGAAMRVRAPATGVAVLSAGVIAVAAAGVPRGMLALAVGSAVAMLTALLARRWVGGSTGDTLGAAVALTEAVACVALAASWR